MNATTLTLLFAPLVGFVFYRRVRRSFGSQPFQPKRMIARMVLLVAVCVLFMTLLPTRAGVLAGVLGTVLGAALSRAGLAHTQLQTTDLGVFYTPNKWIGLGLTSIFLSRLVARSIVIYRTVGEAEAGTLPDPVQIHRSALTLGIYFLFASYYVGYYGALLKRARGGVRVRA